MFHLKRIAVFISFLVLAASGAATQALAEQRIALVIGQGAYESGALPTAVNDAGLLAQTLTSAGFEVVQVTAGAIHPSLSSVVMVNVTNDGWPTGCKATVLLQPRKKPSTVS